MHLKPQTNFQNMKTPCCLTFMLSGTRTLRAFLIIGWGFSSSSLKECLLGSKFCWLELLDRVMSEESMSNIPMASGPLSVGVSRGGHEDEEEEEGDSHESFTLVWLPGNENKTVNLLFEAQDSYMLMLAWCLATRGQQRATFFGDGKSFLCLQLISKNLNSVRVHGNNTKYAKNNIFIFYEKHRFDHKG